MRLKEIKPEMVIHCKTQEEANKLCDAVGASHLWKKYWEKYEDDTCYEIFSNEICSYGKSITFKSKIITEFSDLILPELTAEEAIVWLVKNYGNGTYKEVFGREYILSDLLEDMTPNEVVEKISKWKSEHEKKEPEIETVDICRIIENQPDGRKLCVHEEDLASGSTDAEIKIMVEAELKRYCIEHDGEFIAVHEVVSRVKR